MTANMLAIGTFYKGTSQLVNYLLAYEKDIQHR